MVEAPRSGASTARGSPYGELQGQQDMPYKAKAPETKEFQLKELDAREGIPEDQSTKVTIKQATMRQNAVRAELFSEFIRSYKDGEERYIFKLPLYNLISKEIWLTMVACNIEGDPGIPLFRFETSTRGPLMNMSYETFLDALGILEDEVVQEIHNKVLEVNPHWIIGDLPLEEPSLGEEL